MVGGLFEGVPDSVMLDREELVARLGMSVENIVESLPAGVVDTLTLRAALESGAARRGAERLLLEMRAHVWTRRLPPRQWLESTTLRGRFTVAVEVPATWWQHWRHRFRDTWWGRWSVRRWPVRTRPVRQVVHTTQDVSLTVRASAKVRFPEVALRAPGGTVLVPVVECAAGEWTPWDTAVRYEPGEFAPGPVPPRT